MRRFYEILEDVRDILARKFVTSYELGDVYKATVYALIYTAAQRTSSRVALFQLKFLEKKMPQTLIAAARRKLVSFFDELLEQLNLLLASNEPVIVDGEASLEYVVKRVKREAGGIDYVLVYDCLSLVEELVISAYLASMNVKTDFLNTLFINPVGLTRFLTQQVEVHVGRGTLRKVAEYVASSINALLYIKDARVDKIVHEVGYLGVEEFTDKMSEIIDRIAREVLAIIHSDNRVLIFSDHGYDIVLSKNGYLYVTHGFKSSDSFGDISLISLSRVVAFMVAGGRSTSNVI